MLVITRRKDQDIHLYLGTHAIGSILVCDVDRGRVKLGLDLDDKVLVLRGELVGSGAFQTTRAGREKLEYDRA